MNGRARRDLTRRRLAQTASYAVLTVVTLIMLLPIYAAITIASARTDEDIDGLSFHGFHLFGNLADLFADGTFPRYLLNSIIVAGVAAVLDVAISAAAGYALARLSFPGRRVLFATVVATLSLSPAVVIVPTYVMMRWVGWLDSYQGLILPGAVSAFGVFLVRQFALGIPPQLLHAARIDGAGEWRIFTRLAVPLLRPALLTLFLLSFLAQWDNLIWPLIVANNPDLWTLPVGLAGFEGEHGTNFHLLLTATLVSIVPPLLILAALQRYYVSGLTLGGVKK
ncbi:multiple sugar transport system permease protein [Kribbella antiqua]|uniref:Multiple sugar transport system permease protein n=1 Tax=Kribbella antiqua TaxID=2512217 RepID=A0A4R2IVR5_9ACTN|nr:carbohydrate ABC transporter permease [Kribbella antiqua]TCO49504.1 multiple sugar transport system permease protein [Kribbella antiqua]